MSANQHWLHTTIHFINDQATELTLYPVMEAAIVELRRCHGQGGGSGRLPAVGPTGAEPSWKVGECHRGRLEGHLLRGLPVGKCVIILGKGVRVSEEQCES